MKRLDECQNCGYVFKSEDDEPDYISEIGDAPEPVYKGIKVCPVCGEKRGHAKPKTKKITEETED